MVGLLLSCTLCCNYREGRESFELVLSHLLHSILKHGGIVAMGAGLLVPVISEAFKWAALRGFFSSKTCYLRGSYPRHVLGFLLKIGSLSPKSWALVEIHVFEWLRLENLRVTKVWGRARHDGAVQR